MLLHSASHVIESLVTRLIGIEGPIAVMAGHFSLVMDHQGKLVPGIPEDIEDEATRLLVAQHQYMGNFPVETWRAGIEVVLRLRASGRDAKLLVLVNDWQHVPASQSGKRNESRDAFFANAKLPPALQRSLVEVGLVEADIISDERDGKPCIFWCESKLRARYHRHLKAKVPVESACAQEWVPLLVKLENCGFGSLVAFVPGVCRTPVIGGTEQANEKLELNLQTINVFPMGGADDLWADTWLES